jgi:RNA polymerase sigma-70 factor (ECF subfamily)
MSLEELVQACANSSHPEAWAEFIRRFHRFIASVVTRTCSEWSEASPAVIEDLIQETYLKLCANDRAVLASFRAGHPNAFLGYLKTVTANLVYDHFRSLRASIRNVENTVEIEKAFAQPHTGRGEAELIENQVFFEEIDRILIARGSGWSEQKDRTIFWLYYRQGLTLKKIAAIPAVGLSVKGVESVIYRLTQLVKRSLVLEENKQAKGTQTVEPSI